MIEQWPNVAEALEALRKNFGNAEIADLAGGCYAIEIVVENLGLIWIGDNGGPLGECGNRGWGAELVNWEWEHQAMICEIPERDTSTLVNAIRGFLRRTAA